MDGDMNDIFQKLNSILEDKDMSDNLKNIINNFSSSNTDNYNNSNSCNTDSTNCKCDNNSQNSSDNKSNFEFDINTILKIKKIMDSMNNTQNDSRSNLLCSLKPYLADSKKEKIDQYIKFLNIAKLLEVMNPIGGDSKKNE